MWLTEYINFIRIKVKKYWVPINSFSLLGMQCYCDSILIIIIKI